MMKQKISRSQNSTILPFGRSIWILGLLLAIPMAGFAQPQVCQVTIRAGSWVSTGIRVSAGQKVTIKATGTMRYAEGARIEFGPGGDMYGVWSVKVKIGNQIVDTRDGWTITAAQDGVVELGVPARANLPVEDSAKYLDPNYSLCASVTPEGDHGSGGGGTGSSGPLGAFMYWCPSDISNTGEVQPCTICIQDWVLSNSGGGNMVVRFPNTVSSWGTQSTGLWVFPGGFSSDPITRWESAIWDWGGYQCSKHPGESGVVSGGSPKTPFSREYPWGFFISAVRGTTPGAYNLPIIVSQVNGGTVNLNLPINVVGSSNSRFRCGLGSVWDESESGWTGRWTRRGETNVFDAHWERAGWQPIDQFLSIYFSGNTVTIFREHPATPGNTCAYTGTVGPDGITVSGEYTCNDRGNRIGPARWTATIRCTGGGGGGGGGGRGGGGLTGPIAFQTMNGNYLNAVNGGGIQGPGAINSDATTVSGWETFTLEPLSDGKYAIKTMNGNYLTAMRGGGLTGADVIHTDGRRIDAWEKFSLVPQGDGTYAIQTANGNYLSAVNGGGVGGGRGALHTNATTVQGWEKFKLVPVGSSGGEKNGTSGSGFGPMQYGQDLAEASDYRALDLPESRPELCEAECARDSRCRAYTYVTPGTYDYPRPRCWLKEKTGRFIPNANTVSAVKNQD